MGVILHDGGAVPAVPVTGESSGLIPVGVPPLCGVGVRGGNRGRRPLPRGGAGAITPNPVGAASRRDAVPGCVGGIAAGGRSHGVKWARLS